MNIAIMRRARRVFVLVCYSIVVDVTLEQTDRR